MQLIQILQRLAGAKSNTLQRIIGNMRSNTGFTLHNLSQAVKQRAAAGQINTVINIGMDIGRIIVKNVRNTPDPSIYADSSSSSGIPIKN